MHVKLMVGSFLRTITLTGLAAFFLLPFLALAGQTDLAVVSNVFLVPDVPQPMYFPVTRGGDDAYDIVLGYHTSDGSAFAGLDYVAASGLATIPANQPGTFLPVVINSTPDAPSTYFEMHVDAALGIGPQPDFSDPQSLPVGTSPYSIAKVDLNGDGRIDLLVGNLDDNSVSVLLNTTVAGTTPSFTSQTILAGGQPFVSSADINGDGRPDIIVANYIDKTVSVLLNTTPPGATVASFAARQFFAAGNIPRAITAADINGDGRPDLIVANGTDSTVSVLINTTAPGAVVASFAPQQVFAVNFTATSVIAADFNGDGALDLAVTDYTAAGVSVLLNTTPAGAIVPSFAIQNTFATGSSAIVVSAGDINADGKPDLVVANDTGGTISVLLNETAPGAAFASFAAHQDIPAGAGLFTVECIDINGDGKPDLVAGGSTPFGVVSVLVNATFPGSSTAYFTAPTLFPAGPLPVALVVGDIDIDGKVDVIVTNLASHGVSVLRSITPLGAAASALGARQTFSGGPTAHAVIAADFNGDGKPDFATANFASDSVTVTLNATAPGAWNAQFALPATIPTGSFPYDLEAADFDGDGRPDLAVATHYDGLVSIFLNRTIPGSSTPVFAEAQSFQAGNWVFAVAVADLNADGRPDLVVTDNSNYTMSVMLNTTGSGATTLSFSAPQLVQSSIDAYSVRVGDLNGDGRPDIVASDLDKNNVSIVFNTTTPGAAMASFATPQLVDVGITPLSVVIADVTGDGIPDVLTGNYGSGFVTVLRNGTTRGSMTWTFASDEIPTGTGVTSIATADIGGSGLPDIIAVRASGSGLVLLGTNYYANQLPFAAGNEAVWVTSADVNLDGRPDIIAANQDGGLALLLNEQYRTSIVVGSATGTIIHDAVFSDGFE